MSGDVSIPYGGDGEITLICTLGAAKRVNALYGNFANALHRVTTYDFDAYAAIVAAARGEKIEAVEAGVYAAGMESIKDPLSRYLMNLANGGRAEPKKAPEGAASGEA